MLDEACVRIPLDRQAIGPDGLVADPLVRERIGEVLARLAAG